MHIHLLGGPSLPGFEWDYINIYYYINNHVTEQEIGGCVILNIAGSKGWESDRGEVGS